MRAKRWLTKFSAAGVLLFQIFAPDLSRAAPFDCSLLLSEDLDLGITRNYSGTTVGQSSVINSYSCNGNTWNATGPEKIYKIKTTAGSSELTAQLTGLGADLELFILDACDTSNCIGYSRNGGTTSESSTIPDLAAGNYYIIVDGYGGASSSYNLSFSATLSSKCDTPTPLTLGVPYIGDTTGATNQVSNYTCGGSNFLSTGPENFHSYTASTDGYVKATLNGLSGDLDLYLLENCATGLCTQSSRAGGSTAEEITFQVSANNTYILVVEGYSGAVSPYTLTISDPCTGTVCNDGDPCTEDVCSGAGTCSYNFVCPVITSINPQEADVGTTIQILGSNFLAGSSPPVVTFPGGVTATLRGSPTDTQILCFAPAAAIGCVTVTTDKGVSQCSAP